MFSPSITLREIPKKFWHPPMVPYELNHQNVVIYKRTITKLSIAKAPSLLTCSLILSVSQPATQPPTTQPG